MGSPLKKLLQILKREALLTCYEKNLKNVSFDTLLVFLINCSDYVVEEVKTDVGDIH